MSVHPEDAALYASEQHADLVRIAAALERIAVDLERVITSTPTTSALEVRGLVITREDRP